MYHRIAIVGANGSGKTTFAKYLADMLGYQHMDIEAYHFKASAISYANPRTRTEALELLSAETQKCSSFIISAVNCDFGKEINALYDCIIYIKVPLTIRLTRIRQRSSEKFGTRVLAGGDMYEQEQNFLNFAASRTMDQTDTWLQSMKCPIIYVDGTAPFAYNAKLIISQEQLRKSNTNFH